MTPARRTAPLLPLLLVGLLVLAGCSEADEQNVVEGEAARLGELEYSVEVTRFLNPDDTEDAQYLAGQPRPEPGQIYLGSFVTIHNEDDEHPIRSASEYTLIDIRGDRYEPVDSTSPLALDIGGIVPAGGQLPPSESIAAQGPARGGALIFLVDATINQRLPLTLEIESEAGTAAVQLDI